MNGRVGFSFLFVQVPLLPKVATVIHRCHFAWFRCACGVSPATSPRKHRCFLVVTCYMQGAGANDDVEEELDEQEDEEGITRVGKAVRAAVKLAKQGIAQPMPIGFRINHYTAEQMNLRVRVATFGKSGTCEYRVPLLAKVASDTHRCHFASRRAEPKVAPVSVRCHFWQKWHL